MQQPVQLPLLNTWTQVTILPQPKDIFFYEAKHILWQTDWRIWQWIIQAKCQSEEHEHAIILSSCVAKREMAERPFVLILFLFHASEGEDSLSRQHVSTTIKTAATCWTVSKQPVNLHSGYRTEQVHYAYKLCRSNKTQQTTAT